MDMKTYCCKNHETIGLIELKMQLTIDNNGEENAISEKA